MNKILILLFFAFNISYVQVTQEDFESTITYQKISVKDIETLTLYNVYPLGSVTGTTLIFNQIEGRMLTFKDSGLVMNLEPNHLQDNEITFIPYASIEYFALNEVYLEIILKRETPY